VTAPIPQIAVIIPAFNEAARISPTLSSTALYLQEHFQDWVIWVVNDGSRDSTRQMVEDFAQSEPRVKVHSLDRNRGKGCAVRNGVALTRAEKVLYMDADGAIPINQLEKLLPGLEEAHVVIGSKSFPSKGSIDFKWYRLLMGRIFNFFVRLFLIRGVRDSQCGFKLFRGDVARAIFKNQKVNGFSFDLEVLFLARLMNFTTREVSVKWSNVSGSRINLIGDSLKMFVDIFRIRAIHKGNNLSIQEDASKL